jgi:geranylgeranyl diphosphate synthase type II
MAGAEAAGGSAESVLPFACAIELIHTYSLIHDDLPGIDNDDLRRGVPTCHMRFGEAAAILTGDALLTEAFFVMTSSDLYNGIQAERLLKSAHMLADAAGFRGMVGGQVVDVESEGKSPPLELVEYIHKNKTAALIQASVTSGGYLGGASDSVMQSLSDYGLHLGLAFQIRDDILDEVGQSDVMGKPSGSDRELNKATFPSVLGIDESRRREAAAIQQSLKAIEQLGHRCEPLRAISLYLLDRTH